KTLAQTKQQIQAATQQLAVLNMSTATQQKAIATIAALYEIGFSEKEIIELTQVVDMWSNQNKQWPGMTRGNGSSGGGSSKIFKWDSELVGVKNQKQP